jgi:hypothetical protein
MILKERIEAFAELGGILKTALEGKEDSRAAGLMELVERQHLINPWFTAENVTYSIRVIADQLTKDNLIKWTGAYPALNREETPLRVGIIMAGNIPLVGFHDFLSVLISGSHVIAKTSSKDSELIVKIGEILCRIDDRFGPMMRFSDENLSDFDHVIATGSNNSSRYFDFYFGNYPNIIRKNRNSVAVLDGTETAEELQSLGQDIFLYFGLGCRSVSKIFVPEGYDLKILPPHWESFSGLIHHSKYASNYDFSKAVYLVNREKFLDTGYLLIKEEKTLSSPVAVLYFETYGSEEEIRTILAYQDDKIQCVTGHGHSPFGSAQSPHLWEYADGIDTI